MTGHKTHVGKDEEFFCLYEYKYEEGAPWYQELWRKELDGDHIFGPFGHRGSKRNESEIIPPMISNGTLHAEFYKYATEELKLDPHT